jgi:hypothetical protein
MVPVRFVELRFEIAEPFEAVNNPWMLRLDNVPTLVMFGCDDDTT